MRILKKKLTSDKAKLLSLMQSASEGNFVFCKEEDFRDKKLACAYNALLSKFLQSDTQTAMALNKSMETIGNCNNIRTMLQIVERQKDNLHSIVSTGESLSESVSESEKILNTINQDVTSAYQTSQLSKKAMDETISNVNQSYRAILQADSSMNGFSEKSVAIKDILKIVSDIASRIQILALNARLEASRSQDGEGFAVITGEISNLSADTQESVEQMTQFIHEILADIRQLVDEFNHLKTVLENSSHSARETELSVQEMADNMQNVINQISDLYAHINLQNTETKSYTDHTVNIAKDSDLLASYCKEPVKDMYTISRSIDKVRTKIIKGPNSLTQTNLLDIFDTDHLIFTGRLYNMIEGFEELQLKNLNQPKKCKYGKWIQNLSREQSSLAALFNQANLYHEHLHKLATSCFHANEAGEKEQALHFFEQAQEVYQSFSAELRQLKIRIANEGIVGK